MGWDDRATEAKIHYEAMILELEAENKRLREILRGLVKNRNRAMKVKKPAIYFENMRPFWKMAEEIVEIEALEGSGK